jgi:hypothetical protein
MHRTRASRSRPSATTMAALGAAALVGTVIPAAVGLAFLISLAVRRPLIVVAARRGPGSPAARPPCYPAAPLLA